MIKETWIRISSREHFFKSGRSGVNTSRTGLLPLSLRLRPFLFCFFFFFIDFQMTNDFSKRALCDDLMKRTKGESELLCRLSFDLHVSHKHLMDSINCVPGGSVRAQQKGGEWSKLERASGTTALPCRLARRESHLLERSGVHICLMCAAAALII